MKRVVLWLALPVVFLAALFGAVMKAPDFITVNFMFVWFAMVLVVIGASLGILWTGLKDSGPETTEPHGPAETSHD